MVWMATLLSLERYVPPYRYEQAVVTEWVRRWLEADALGRLAAPVSVYAAAGVHERGSVVPIEEVFAPADFETQNRRYREIACTAGADVAARALEASGLEPADIAFVVSVSCTGFMIPAVDAYVANALSLGPRLSRLPITEAGCAGGVVGLARVADYLAAHPDRAALLLALEMSSLTFQRVGPLGHERRLDRDLRRRRRRGGPGRPGAPARLARPRPHRRPRELVLPRHDAPHGLRPAELGPADPPRQGARPVRETRGPPRGRGLPSRPRPRPLPDRALHPPPRRPASDRGDGGAARPRAVRPRLDRGGPRRARQHELGDGALRARRDPAPQPSRPRRASACSAHSARASPPSWRSSSSDGPLPRGAGHGARAARRGRPGRGGAAQPARPAVRQPLARQRRLAACARCARTCLPAGASSMSGRPRETCRPASCRGCPGRSPRSPST